MSNSLKQKHWFPHPANLRNDRKMKRAMKDLPGGVGYGVIVLMMEVLRNEPKFRYPMKDLDLLASEFDISLPILQTVIKSYGFFELSMSKDGEMFISPVLNELMIPYLEKQKQNQIAGKISAQKRKLKQEQQLLELSRFNSNQHMLSAGQTVVTHNIQQQTTEEKKKSLWCHDFKFFKDLVIQKYKDQVVCYGAANFERTTGISITTQGYLHNTFSNKDLSSDDAKIVWKWMFENQDKLCEIEVHDE
ncbi:MAG: DUF4373 domain-containing protein [Campylobacterales bacterium]|nr:DUF4373 domain-containing protein [Campylobacterales bacterium]